MWRKSNIATGIFLSLILSIFNSLALAQSSDFTKEDEAKIHILKTHIEVLNYFLDSRLQGNFNFQHVGLDYIPLAIQERAEANLELMNNELTTLQEKKNKYQEFKGGTIDGKESDSIVKNDYRLQELLEDRDISINIKNKFQSEAFWLRRLAKEVKNELTQEEFDAFNRNSLKYQGEVKSLEDKIKNLNFNIEQTTIRYTKDNPFIFSLLGGPSVGAWMGYCDDNENIICIFFKYADGQQTKVKFFDKSASTKACEDISFQVSPRFIRNGVLEKISFDVFCKNMDRPLHSGYLWPVFTLGKKSFLTGTRGEGKTTGYKLLINFFDGRQINGLNSQPPGIDAYDPVRGFGEEDREIHRLKLDDLIVEINKNKKEIDVTKKIKGAFLEPLTEEGKIKLMEALKKINEEDYRLEAQQKQKRSGLFKFFGF